MDLKVIFAVRPLFSISNICIQHSRIYFAGGWESMRLKVINSQVFSRKILKLRNHCFWNRFTFRTGIRRIRTNFNRSNLSDIQTNAAESFTIKCEFLAFCELNKIIFYFASNWNYIWIIHGKWLLQKFQLKRINAKAFNSHKHT